MTTRARWRRAVWLVPYTLAALLAAGVALAGCSTTTNSGGSAGPPAPAGARDAELAGQGGGVAPAPSAAEKPADPQQAQNKVEPAQRSIIYAGSMRVRVDNVKDAADKATDIATGFGGLVGGDSRNLNDSLSEAELTLRVPADKFEAALDALAALGDEKSRAIKTEDVTEAVLDLDVRLASQQQSVERVRALLARAQTIGEVVSVEGELTRREAELASLKTKKDRLADLVALSTITVTLLGPAAPTPDDQPDTGFLAGLKSGWEGFLKSVELVLTVAGFLLPWIIAIAVPVWLLVWFLRRRERPALAPVGATGPATSGLPQAPPPADTPQS